MGQPDFITAAEVITGVLEVDAKEANIVIMLERGGFRFKRNGDGCVNVCLGDEAITTLKNVQGGVEIGMHIF